MSFTENHLILRKSTQFCWICKLTTLCHVSLLVLVAGSTLKAGPVDVMGQKIPYLHETSPYWKRKPKVFKKMMNERSIQVQVNILRDSKILNKKLKFLGGGIVNTIPEQAFSWVIDFQNLKKLGKFIKSVRVGKNIKQVHIFGEAFGYYAKMNVRVDVISKKSIKMISWKMLPGSFYGMNGQIILLDAGSGKTEFVFEAIYPYKSLGFPKFFVEFGFEVILQKMAYRVRELMEDVKVGI